FDDLAHLEHAPQELRIDAGFGEPRQDVGVEEAPRGLRQDHGATLRAGFDQALGREDLRRLPHHGPADAELAAQLSLLRKDLARGELAPDDASPDALHDPGVNPSRCGLAGDHGAFGQRYILLYDSTGSRPEEVSPFRFSFG